MLTLTVYDLIKIWTEFSALTLLPAAPPPGFFNVAEKPNLTRSIKILAWWYIRIMSDRDCNPINDETYFGRF